MASDRMQAVMLRRQALLAKIAGQRGQMADLPRDWYVPLAVADGALVAVRFARGHPLLVTGVAAGVVVNRRGLTGLARLGWRIWKAYRFLNEFSGKLMR